MTIPLRLDPRGSLASDRPDRPGASLGRQVTTVAVVLGGGLLLGAMSRQLALAALIVAVVIGVAFIRSLLAHPELLVNIAVYSMWFDSVGVGSFRVGRAIAVLVAVVMVLRLALTNWRPPALDRRAWLPIAVFVGWALASGLWADKIGSWAVGIGELSLGVVFGIIYLYFLESEAQLAKAFKVFVWLGVPLSIVGYVAFERYDDLVKEAGVEDRVVGFTGNANALAALYMATIPLAVVFFRRSTRRIEQAGYLVVIAAMFVGLVSTGSRAGLLLLGAILMYVFVTSPGFTRRERVWTGLAGFFVTLIAFLIAGALNPERYSLSGFLSPGGAGREDFWNAAVKTFGSHPIQGSGMGVFRNNMFDILSKVSGGSLDPTRSPINRNKGFLEAHNMYLTLLLDLGIMGMVAWVGMYVSVLRNLWGQRNSVYRDWVWAFGGIHLSVLITAMFASDYNTKFQWTVIGFSGAAYGRTVVRHDVDGRLETARATGQLRHRLPFVRLASLVALVAFVLTATSFATFGSTRHVATAEVFAVQFEKVTTSKGMPLDDSRIQLILNLVRSDLYTAEVAAQADLSMPISELRDRIDATRLKFSAVVQISVSLDSEADARRASMVLVSSLDSVFEKARANMAAADGTDTRDLMPDVPSGYVGPLYMRFENHPEITTIPPRTIVNGLVGALVAVFGLVCWTAARQDGRALSTAEGMEVRLGSVPIIGRLGRLPLSPLARQRRRAARAASTAFADTVMARTPVPADGSAPVVGMSADGIDRLRADAVLSLLGGLIDTSDRPVVFVDLAGDVGPRLGLRGRPGVGEVVHGRETLDAVLVSVPCDRLPRSVRSRPDGPRTGDGSDPETEPGSFRALPAGQLAVRDAEAEALGGVIESLRSTSTVVVDFGDIEGRAGIGEALRECDLVGVVVLDGWTEVVPTSAIAGRARAAGAEVGVLVIDNGN